MSVTDVLLDLMIVLIAAKLAAEASERLGFPAVAGEIIVGILIGPSALDLVQGNDVLLVLAELGVILLLLDVGLEMDISELMVVGRASFTVATLGVLVPLFGGWGVAMGLGLDTKPALFVGAALTATSVGITARVFGDLKALNTTEARTVIGAAVADDVMGLVILTVVGRLVTDGGVSVWGVSKVVLVALGFLALASYVGIRLAPPVFARISEHSRSRGTLIAAAVIFTLGFSELANEAKLAPIVGAFVAGLALGRTPTAGRIRRELVPIGHIFVPIFFVQIGLDADVREFGSGAVLRDAGLLLAVAIVGKLASALGLFGAPGDRLTVGLAMIPRGEVGLIFAAIGLRQGILSPEIYASLLLVVLVTTLMTPPALRWRMMRLGRRARAPVGEDGAGGPPWLAVGHGEHHGPLEIRLLHEPPADAALEVAFHAARLADEHRPSSDLLDWLADLPERGLAWTPEATERLFEVLQDGGPRAWRFLGLTGVLDRALPELGTALARRQADVSELDPLDALRWPRLHQLAELKDLKRLRHPEHALLAAVVLDAAEHEDDAASTARRVVQRMRLGPEAEHDVSALVGDAELLMGAARRVDSFDEETVLQLAIHLGSPEQARALYLLTLASEGVQPWDVPLVTELHDLVQQALAHPELTGSNAVNVAEHRRASALALTADPPVRARIESAPRAYMLTVAPEVLARQADLCEPPVPRDDVRVDVVDDGRDQWRIDFVSQDRLGLLARESLVISNTGADVIEALAATWGDGTALASFRVQSTTEPDVRILRDACLDSFTQRVSTSPQDLAEVDFDDLASPWHTVCRVTAPDRHRLLYAITAAFSEVGVSVHSARIATVDDAAVDVFALTDKNGNKLNESLEKAIVKAIHDGVPTPRSILPWRGGRRENV